MHILEEQGAIHAHVHEDEIHSHEHTHADGTTHTHPHMHDHGEGHGHTHDHGVPGDLEKVKAIMKYMVEHNEHHAEELADLLGMLPEDAQKKLTRAIGTFEAANVELRCVLESLEKQ